MKERIFANYRRNLMDSKLQISVKSKDWGKFFIFWNTNFKKLKYETKKQKTIIMIIDNNNNNNDN